MVKRVYIDTSTFNVSKAGYDASNTSYNNLLMSLSSKFGQVIQSGNAAATMSPSDYSATVYITDFGAYVDAVAIPVLGGQWVNYQGIGWTAVYYGYGVYRRDTSITDAIPDSTEFNTVRTFNGNSVTFQSPRPSLQVGALNPIVTEFTYYIFRKPLAA